MAPSSPNTSEPLRAAPGECRAAKEHVEAMWQRTLERSPSPAVATEITVQLVSSETVAATPLSLYDNFVDGQREVA
jgi:hypothetical protein